MEVVQKDVRYQFGGEGIGLHQHGHTGRGDLPGNNFKAFAFRTEAGSHFGVLLGSRFRERPQTEQDHSRENKPFTRGTGEGFHRLCPLPAASRKNAIERAIILSRGGPLRFDEILAPLRSATATDFGNHEPVLTLNEVQARQIRRVLEKTGGRVEGKGGAADLLNINPGTLRHRMRKLGIPFGKRK